MKTKNQVAIQKKIVTQKCGELLKRMTNSKNDLERVQVLQEMDSLLQNEIDHWHNVLLEPAIISPEELEILMDEAAVHTTDLKTIQDKIAPMVAEYLPNALQLQAHKLRTGELSEPVIKHVLK